MDSCIVALELQAFSVTFFNASVCTTVTRSPAIVTQWIHYVKLLGCRLIGLDIESRPAYSHRYRNRVHVLQLCVGHNCLIFQLKYASYIPDRLIHFLASEDYTVVGVDIHSAFVKLEEDYGFRPPPTAVDLRNLASAAYRRPTLEYGKLEQLAMEVLGKAMDKPEWMSRSMWDSWRLTRDQVKYACIDAYVCFEIGRVLNAIAHRH